MFGLPEPRFGYDGRMRWGIALGLSVLLASSPASAYQLDDSLKGSTVGHPVGGSIGANGWTVTNRTDRLWYSIPTLVSGSIEFTVTGLTTAGLISGDNELFAMYEDGYGMGEPIAYNPPLRDNYEKCMLRVYGPDDATRVGQQKLMWGICNGGDPGYGTCPCATSFFDEPFGGDGNWDGSPQRIRIEWGSGHTRLLRNGGVVLDIDYSSTGLVYGPSEQHFSLGTARASEVGTAGMPTGIVFSDVSVSGTQGSGSVCTPPPPDAGGAGSGGTAGATSTDGGNPDASSSGASGGSGGLVDSGASGGGGGGGALDGGLPSRGSTVADKGGCGCRVARSRGGTGALFAAMTALLAGWRRRRA